MEEPKLFETVHTAITNILTCRKKGIESAQIVQPMVRAMMSGSKLVSSDEKVASGGAVLVASKLLLTSATHLEKCHLIPVFTVSLDMVESPDKISTLRWTNLQSLFMNFIAEMPEDSPTALKYLKFVENLIEFAKKSEKVKNDFFKPTNLAILSKGISVSLGILCDRKKDTSLRKCALSLLSKLVSDCPNNQLNTISTVIPGVLSKLFDIITKDSNENVELLEKAIHIFGSCVIDVLADSSFLDSESESESVKNFDENEVPESLSKFLANRGSEEWRKETSENVQNYIVAICSTLASHRNLDVKTTMMNMLENIQKYCSSTFQDTLFPVIIDVYLLLVEESRNQAEAMLHLVTENNHLFLEQRLYNKLDELTAQLPTSTRTGQAEMIFKMLTSVIRGMKGSIEVLCNSSSPQIIGLVRSLADSVIINTKKLMITKNDSASSLGDQLQNYPLMYGVKHCEVEKIVRILVKNGGSEIVGILYSEMLNSSSNQKCSFALLMAYCFLEKIETADESIFFTMGDYFIQIVGKLSDRRLKSDEVVQDLSYETNMDCCLESLICINMALCVDYYGDDAKNKSKHLIDILYTLLFECSSTSWQVQEAAQFGITVVSRQCCSSESIDPIPAAMSYYGGYIVHKISLACSSAEDHHFAPIVFQNFLNRCEDSQFFENCVHIVQKLLTALDQFEQKHVISILYALKDFVGAVNRWFPELKPETVIIDGEEKEQPIAQMAVVERILNRAKHFLTSSLLPVRIVTLGIVNEGLHSLRNFDDMLLPMVHQNWQSLMTIVDSSEPTATTSALLVAKRMAQVSSSFIQRRVLNELWPKLENFGLEEIRKRNFYSQTANFKLLREVIISFAEICIFCKMDREQCEKSILQFYKSCEECGNADILKICGEQKKQIEEYLEESEGLEKHGER